MQYVACFGMMLLLATVAPAQTDTMTLGEARLRASRLRERLVSGSARFSASSETIGNDGKTLGNTSVGEIRFDDSAYTNQHRRVTTIGYVYTVTDSTGVQRKGLDSADDAIYLRRGTNDLLGDRFLVDRNSKRISSIDFFNQEWEVLAIHRDLLAIGRVLPEMTNLRETDSLLLRPDSDGFLTGNGNFNGVNIKVKVSPSSGYLITDAVVIKDGSEHRLHINETQQVRGYCLPKKVQYDIIDRKRNVRSTIASNFNEVGVNDGSTAYPVTLNPGQLAYGWRDNTVYSFDANGRPKFTMKQGVTRGARYGLNYVYVGSMALLLFVASGTLVRSLLKRRAR